MAQNKIRDIVIVGGGTAGWMAAAALSKVMGTEQYSITVVESDQIGTVGVGEATIPMIQLYNSVLGLDEDEFVRETNGTFKLGIEFVDWRRLGHSYFHPFGLLGQDMEGIPFGNYWLRWAKAGGNADFGRFNAETEAARANKFMRTTGAAKQAALPDIHYAYQFDAGRYAAFLRRYSEKRGAVRIEGKIVKVHQNGESGHVESVELEDGRKVGGHFFIDCSGFRGLLIEETLKAGYDDWSKWLPVNRAAAVPCERAGDPTPYTRATAREAGWQWRIPLQHRTGNGYVFCDGFITEDEAKEKLMGRLDGKAMADPKVLRFVTGRRRKSWSHNVLAMGLSSGFLEPLESTSIHLIQVAISKLLAYFPRDHFDDAVIDAFNREMSGEYENVKDFLIAHYKVTEREDTPFWQYCKHMEIPDTLQTRLEVFKRRGDMMVKHYELFKETSWFAVLVGQGLVPDAYHPVADVISDDELKMRLSRLRTAIQDRVNSMPGQDAYIRQNGLAAAAM